MPASASQISTTIALSHWEVGPTAAERLCADVLRLEGFDKVDPQSPLGGGDGGKDILCEKDGLTFVAACHFPHETISFAHSKRKFLEDLEAALKHGRDAFVFMTNQPLTPADRTELEKEAAARGQRCRIMHREHLRVILDSPQGYAVRYRHLRLGMTPEEQAAYFAASGESTAAALANHTRAIHRLSDRVDRLARNQDDLVMQTVAVVAEAVRGTAKEKMSRGCSEILYKVFGTQLGNLTERRFRPVLLQFSCATYTGCLCPPISRSPAIIVRPRSGSRIRLAK